MRATASWCTRSYAGARAATVRGRSMFAGFTFMLNPPLSMPELM
jgi:hypothetical protein